MQFTSYTELVIIQVPSTVVITLERFLILTMAHGIIVMIQGVVRATDNQIKAARVPTSFFTHNNDHQIP